MEAAFATARAVLAEQSALVLAELERERRALAEERAALQRSAAEERDAVAKAREALEREKDQMADFVERSSSDVVELNVGGEVMAALRSTLTLAPGSLLEAIFSGRHEQTLTRDAAGRVFLNHSPAPFKSFLSYSRVREEAKPGEVVASPAVAPEFKAELASMLKTLKLEDYVYGPLSQWTAPAEALRFAPPTQSPETVVLAGSVVTRSQPGGSKHNAVVGGAPLLGADVRRQTAVCKVSLTNYDTSAAGSNGWFFFGVLGVPEVATYCYNLPSSHCWGNVSDYVYVAGSHQSGRGGWPGWQDGDVAILRLDALPVPRLRMFLQRTRIVYEMPLPSEADARQMRLAVSLYASVRVELAAATAEELQQAGLAEA